MSIIQTSRLHMENIIKIPNNLPNLLFSGTSGSDGVKPQFKILTIFTCSARHKLSIMSRPDLAGVLSFEPRPSPPGNFPGGTNGLNLSQLSNVTEVNYCDQRSLTTLQLARLGSRLSKSGKLSVVYTYSSASASAMKLLAGLILRGRVPLTSVDNVPQVRLNLDLRNFLPPN